MKDYNIILINKNNQKRISENISKLTFPEAVRESYKRKNKLGFDWEIDSIIKIKEDISD